jgi:hypothetical protein
MTGRGKKTRRPDASARTVAAAPGPAQPETRLPLRHTVNGYRMRHVDFAGTERLSMRTWDKGSARGEGPQKRREGLVVAASAPWVPCEDCPSLRPVGAAGRHGAMPARAVVAGWPACAHGVPHWENCRGQPVVPPCCLGVVP